MNEEEIKALQELLRDLVGLQTTGGFINGELARRERIKERYAYLKQGMHISTEEQLELKYVTFLVEEYYIKNPIV